MDKSNNRQGEPWFGLHILVYSDTDVENLIQELSALSQLGINVIIIEVNYHFAFEAHPELRADTVISKDSARKLTEACNELGITMIPQFQCLGHQSWSEHTFPLLQKYPYFDETPGQYPANEGIYCRSWCPQNPKVNAIIFSLLDEIIQRSRTSMFHIGMDEVFLIGSDYCSYCRGQNPAHLFKKGVLDLYGHLVKRRSQKLLMWGDRLLNSNTTGYGKWEASENNTHYAIDMIPNDIIICDWHYSLREDYPSIPIFLSKGFEVIACGWDDIQASQAFFDYAFQQKAHNQHMLGYLCTTWGKAKPGALTDFSVLRHLASKYISR
jgi:hypothetical protein